MSNTADIALEFAKECMGWEDAKLSMWGPHSNKMVVTKRGRAVVNRLRFTDLAAVMDAVRGWCDRTNHRLEIQSNRGNGTARWLVQIRLDGELSAFQARDSLAHALLAACVEASRKLKTAP